MSSEIDFSASMGDFFVNLLKNRVQSVTCLHEFVTAIAEISPDRVCFTELADLIKSDILKNYDLEVLSLIHI